jgi:cholesterol transport system auxiliary component
MNKRPSELYLKLFLIMSPVIIPGCSRESYEKQQYILDTQRASSALNIKNTNIIEVRRFTINPAFSAKELTYRTGHFKYETDFYNEFLVSPAVMITEKVRNWLSASGLFQRVLEPGSYVEPTHIIEGNIVTLYGDYRDKSSPTAVMEIRVFLLKTKAVEVPAIVFGKTYISTARLESKGPEGLIAGFDECLENILTSMESDLSDNL